MIAGIDHQADIDLYLEADEVARLQNQTIEGVLIKIHKPKSQGIITISINDARKNENGCGVGINDKGYWGVQDGFRVEVFLGSSWYQELRERRCVGLRHKMLDGSKINIFDRSRLNETPIPVSGPEYLENYRDNRDKLLPEFG